MTIKLSKFMRTGRPTTYTSPFTQMMMNKGSHRMCAVNKLKFIREGWDY